MVCSCGLERGRLSEVLRTTPSGCAVEMMTSGTLELLGASLFRVEEWELRFWTVLDSVFGAFWALFNGRGPAGWGSSSAKSNGSMLKDGRTGAVVDLDKVGDMDTFSFRSCDDEVRVLECVRTRDPSFICVPSTAPSWFVFVGVEPGEASFRLVGDAVFLGGDSLSTTAFASFERPWIGEEDLPVGLRSLSATARRVERPTGG